MCVITGLSMLGTGIAATMSAIGSATAAAGTAVGATAAAGATALGVGATAAGTTGGIVAGLTTGALNGALLGTATGAIGAAATGQKVGRGALVGAGIGAAGGAVLSGAGMVSNGVQPLNNGLYTAQESGVMHAGGGTNPLNWTAVQEASVKDAAGVSASASTDKGELAKDGLKALAQGAQGGIQAYAATEQAKADALQLKDQAKQKNWQAQIEQENAEIEMRDRRRQFRQMRGAGRAQAAANGMLVEGSNVQMWEQDLAAEAAYDSWKIGENANRRAWGYRQEAKQLARQASQVRRTGNLKSAASLITGGIGMFGQGASLFA